MLDSQNKEHEIFLNKRPDKIYVSKQIEDKTFVQTDKDVVEEKIRPLRIASVVLDSPESHHFIKSGKEIILRVTGKQRQEIKAKFYEDTRGIQVLQIQRYSVKDGTPHNISFSFIGDEIVDLYNFINSISIIELKDSNSQKISYEELKKLSFSKEQYLEIVSNDLEILQEILNNNITHSDIVAIGYRKEQLGIFEKLLFDEEYFNRFKIQQSIDSDEKVWQNFFEKNTWIFGYGLNYIFNTPLSGKKLEQVVAGYNVFSAGKRVDALMTTRGLISSLCFAEIKTHKKQLLNRQYRPESFSISDDLAGGIAQIQKTVQKSIIELKTKIEQKDKNGNPTGENVFLYQPKSFLIIGCLKEFVTDNGINEDKFSSFELFRKNITNPEIITFDELYERAKYIVDFLETK